MPTPKLITLFILLSCIWTVHADAPLGPPERYEVSSPSHKFVATLDPHSGVRVNATGFSEARWALTNWFRIAFLADDGDHFVTGYDGMNLIPQNYTKDLVLITFWRRDHKIRDVTLAELFPDTRVLKRTVSHYHWGSINGIMNSTLVVTRCDDKVLKFDVTTGRISK